MKTVVTLDDTDRPDLPWPEGVPLPVPGDYVSMQVDGETLSCSINSRAFEIGIDEATQEPLVRIRIKGGRGLAAS